MTSVFLSYSHKDEEFRDELEVHLHTLKRQGVINIWHDRRLVAGSEFANSITQELESADIILLLVSQYFIASDYCYDIEMKRAMERHESSDAVVIPVILRVCDWHPAPFGKLLGVPKDGKPISKYADMNDAYLEIVNAIKKVVGGLGTKGTQTRNPPITQDEFEKKMTKPLPRSSNLRVKKEFTDKQKDDFLEDSFEYIANFFEGSLVELCERNPQLEFKFKRIDANHFTAFIYKSGAALSQCKIWLSGSFFGDIAYSGNASSSDNSANDFVDIDDDGHQMFFQSSGFATYRSNENAKLSQEGIAEYFWDKLISGLQ